MIDSELSEEVRRFQETGKDWDELANRISVFIYMWALNKKAIGGELASEFYLSFYPRINALVKNYREFECPFEHYMRVCLDWHSMRFHGSIKEEEKKEEIYWETTGKFELLLAAQKQEEYGPVTNPIINLPRGIEKDRFKKRLLQFLIYHVDYIRQDMIGSYADFLEIDENKLRDYLKEAEKVISKKKTRKEEILQKKRSYFIDIKYQEMQLRITEDREKRQEILAQITRLRERMEGLKQRAGRIKMTPTTVQVAKITGFPPSTAGRDIKLMRQYLSGSNHMGSVYDKALFDRRFEKP